MQRSELLSTLLVITMLTACTEPDGSPGRGIMHGGALNKEDVGTAVGAVGGGLVGSAIGGGAGKVIAVVGGTLLGGILGNTVGRSLDNADRAAYDAASQRALERGERQSWRNSHTGHHGVIVPKTSYTNDEGQLCRKYTQTIYIHGKPHTGYGRACRSSDGTWQIVNE